MAVQSGGVAGLAGSRPNIVFILTDDQGYGEVAAHGNPHILTPAMDQLRADGVAFDRFQVSPTCAPTRSALLTGRHEFKNRISHTILGRSLLREDACCLPELLRGAGYATAMFGKWHLGDNYPNRPQDRGYDEALYHQGGGITQTPDYWGNTYFSPTCRQSGRWEPTEGYCTDVFFAHALDWMARRKDDQAPFFCHIATNCPHRPLQVPRADLDRYADAPIDDAARRYYAMISNVDDNLARLREQLEEWGIAGETLVIFMGDNGSAEAGRPERGLYNAGMRGAKGSCYEGGTRVPCFFAWPGRLPAGQVTEALTAHVDFLPTLAAIGGAAVPPGTPLDGRSLTPLLEDPAAPWEDRFLVTHVGRWGMDEDPAEYKLRSCSVRSARYRWANGKELYDLATDPGEQTNLIDQEPAIAARHAAFYEQWWAEVLPEVRTPVRIPLGHEAENPVELNCHDWQRSQVAGDDPDETKLAVWQQNCLAQVAAGEAWEQRNQVAVYGGMGSWAVTVAEAGDYRFTLRKVPAHGRADIRQLAAGTAHVRCGEGAAAVPVQAGADAAVIDLALSAGEAWLECWFTGQRPDGKAAGAFFVTVERQ